ncbi:hypothetical protein [Amycolatopsis orientalis]|uniref:hypothetical protein n=1 Tax=Amycolatopsis orientalis TaxID=31958 RepID=UPI00041602F0|nr:hypothetical protein [Amycolatopsis orientalis]
MTTTPAAPGPNDRESDREVADALARFVSHEADELENHATADEMAAWPRSEKIASAQLMALQAIHSELRHGHDQAALQLEALTKHTKALAEHNQDARRARRRDG